MKRLLTKYKIIAFFESKRTVCFGKPALSKVVVVLGLGSRHVGLDRQFRGYALHRYRVVVWELTMKLIEQWGVLFSRTTTQILYASMSGGQSTSIE